MGRALKYLLRLAVLALLGLAAYALLADLPPPSRNVEVELAVPETGRPAAPAAPAEAQDGSAQDGAAQDGAAHDGAAQE